MIPILTSIIGLVARGSVAKAIAGGVASSAVMAAEPLLTAFQMGLISGAGDSVEQLGVAVGRAIAGFIVGYVITWLSPANTPKDKDA